MTRSSRRLPLRPGCTVAQLDREGRAEHVAGADHRYAPDDAPQDECDDIVGGRVVEEVALLSEGQDQDGMRTDLCPRRLRPRRTDPPETPPGPPSRRRSIGRGERLPRGGRHPVERERPGGFADREATQPPLDEQDGHPRSRGLAKRARSRRRKLVGEIGARRATSDFAAQTSGTISPALTRYVGTRAANAPRWASTSPSNSAR